MNLIIDADPIVYRSGFAAEKVNYQAVIEDEAGNQYAEYFTPSEDETAYKLLQERLKQPGIALIEAEKLVDVEPVSHALMIVRQTLESIMKEVNFKDKDQAHILLSGPGNYREKLATYRPYKGNRDPEHKPVHYQAIRDYLTQQWNAIVVSGREADDEASILAHRFRKRRQKYVIASIDKDLHQIPGVHYDYRLKQQVTVSPEDARLVLWRQALSGDTTDNIPGACGIGVGKAQKIVEEWLDDAEITDAQLWQLTVGVYLKQATAKSDCYYANRIEKWSPDSEGAREQEAAIVARENMRLVYLQREPNELWVPPGHEPEYLEEVDLDD